MSEKKTLIEEGTEFLGTLVARHPVVVTGTVEGDMTGPALEIGASGVVAGKIKVGELRSSGEIAGEIDADEVHLSGRVRDKTILRAKQIEVKISASDGRGVQFGDCDIEIGEIPEKEAIVTAAAGARDGSQPAASAEQGVPQPLAAEGSAPVNRKNRKRGDDRVER